MTRAQARRAAAAAAADPQTGTGVAAPQTGTAAGANNGAAQTGPQRRKHGKRYWE